MKQVVYVTSYSFLNDFIFESQAQNFTVGKAVTGLRKIEEQLIDLCNTGNPLAEKVMAKFQSVVTMNKGLKKAELLGQGTDAREPMDMVLFMNSPARSLFGKTALRMILSSIYLTLGLKQGYPLKH